MQQPRTVAGEAALLPPVGETGLSTQQAHLRFATYGPNRLIPETRYPSLLVWLFRALVDPMAVLLLVAGGIYLLLGSRIDAIVTLVALIPIILVSLALEVRAERTLEQLRRLTAPTATVRRDGAWQTVAAEAIVPDDLFLLQEGDIIPADGWLVAGSQVLVDESALTGESQPAVKDAAAEDRHVFAGTTVLAGRGIARVSATGVRTRYGQIGALAARIRQPPTPLQRLIRRLLWQLAAVAAVFCVGVVGIDLARGAGWGAALIAGVSLAIAAIPEEFPMVFTLYLTLGAWRLARERVLVRRLAGVETLGSTTVICADKTGTLTLGSLELATLATPTSSVPADGPLDEPARQLLEAAVLASEPAPFDPLEQAILRCAAKHGLDVAALHRGALVHDYPFDPVGRYMSHVWQHDGQTHIYAKGAIEGILDRSRAPEAVRRWAQEMNQRLASQGMRVLAVAGGSSAGVSHERAVDERALHFAGLIAFSDPPRPGVAEALAECRAAGVRVVMITGDHPVTALAVAEGLGLQPIGDRGVVTGNDLDTTDDVALAALVRDVSVFARTRPEQKHRLVRALRAQGEIVAMTGDGINDAPALREADIGVAMGLRGTEAARAAAMMVLLDDNFATIVAAVRNGRRIIANLRRAFTYLIAFHVPLLLVALIIPLLGEPLLLLPVHLVWLELIVHPTASLVFEADQPPPDLMRRPPRPPRAALLTGRDFLRTLAEGISLCVGVLALYLAWLGQDLSEAEARGTAVAALILGQTMLVLLERSPDKPVWRAGVMGNRALPAVLGATVASLLLALYTAPLAGMLKVAPLRPADWVAVAITVAAATLWREPLKAVAARRRSTANDA